MRVFFAVALVVLASAALQVSWWSGVHPPPDGALAAALAVSFIAGPEWGALTGFLGGFLQDVLSGGSLGGFCWTGFAGGWLAGSIFKRVYSGNILTVFLGMVLGSLARFAVLRGWAVLWGSAGGSFWPADGSVWLAVQGILGLGIWAGFKKWLFPAGFEV